LVIHVDQSDGYLPIAVAQGVPQAAERVQRKGWCSVSQMLAQDPNQALTVAGRVGQ